MDIEFQKLSLKNDIQSKVRNDLDHNRENILNQQLKTIQEELGGSSNHKDIDDMKLKSKTKNGIKTLRNILTKLLKLQRMNIQAAEYSIQRNSWT